MYIDISGGFVVYSTFLGHIFFSYVKYFISGEKVEIARVKGESIHFYIFGNELNYNCIENDNIQGTYVIL